MRHERVLLFTDAVDSTLLTERLGDEAASTLWGAHDRAVRQLVRECGGREIDKSDGFLLLFDEVDAAVACALALHRELARLAPPLACRAGIHRGTTITRENSADDQAIGAKPVELDGIVKAVASRIMALARGGQTLISAEANAALSIRTGWQSTSHGHWRMKGLAEPIELLEVALAGAPMLPPPDSQKAYRVVREDGRWTPRAELRHGLPAERDGFIGRHGALSALAACFDGGARLVSVLGIGGIGKTRLALRYARDWLGDHPGGAWFCDLSSSRSFDGIVHAVAQGLDVPLGKSDPVKQLGAAIAGRGRCLVVLDNFEQVSRYAEQTVGLWLEHAPEARFLVTSREVLGVAGEEGFVLAPMDAGESVDLFERRARATDLRYVIEPDEQVALSRLVELLDGLPLAIELAAARVRVMGVRAMLERMGERFKLLATTSVGRRDRQATLRAALDWSWELLTSIEQTVLMQLSVFEGGFTLEAAEAVVDLSLYDGAPWLADVLQGLVEKSLLGRSVSFRFRFLRTVLDYLAERTGGAEQAWAAPMVLAAMQRHSRYFATLDETAATADRCAEADNLMLACKRALSDDKTLAVGALVNLWATIRMIGPLSAIAAPLAALEGVTGLAPQAQARLHWVAAGLLHQTGDLAQALHRAGAGLQLAIGHADSITRVTLELTVADVLRSLGRLGESAEHARHALAGAEVAGDSLATLAVLNSLGALHQIKGEYRDAARHYHRALDLARVAGRERWAGGLLGNLAVIARREGRLQESLRHFEDALALAERIGDRQWESNNRSNLALLHHDLGNSAAAAEQLEHALRIIGEIGYAKLERFALCNLGIVREAMGDHDGALSCFERALALCVSAGDHHSECEFRGYLALHVARAGDHARAGREFEKALAELREMDSPSALMLLLAQAALAAALGGQPDRSQALAAEGGQLLAAPGASNSTECSRLLHEAESVRGQR